MADRMSPDLSRRLASAMARADTFEESVAVRTAVEKAGADSEGPGELTFDDLPEPARKAIIALETAKPATSAR